jgi:predicted oxidoreductase
MQVMATVVDRGSGQSPLARAPLQLEDGFTSGGLTVSDLMALVQDDALPLALEYAVGVAAGFSGMCGEGCVRSDGYTTSVLGFSRSVA